MRNRRVAAEEGSTKIRLDDIVPGCNVRVCYVAKNSDAGVVDEDIETAELPHGCLDGAGRIIRITDVRDRGVNPIASPGLAARQLVARLVKSGGGASGDRDTGTGIEERRGDRQPDSTRPTGHESDPPAEIERWRASRHGSLG